MGTVHLAERLDTGQQVAVKIVYGGTLPTDVEKVQIEQTGAAIQQQVAEIDARVARVNRTLQADGSLLVEMEYVPGGDLLQAIRQGPLAPGRAACIARELCLMLDNLSRQTPPVVHGDLKPRNVLLCRPPSAGEAQIKVIDFGIAKQLGHWDGTYNPYQSFPYSSPERLKSSVVNVQSDLWSVGVILYELVAGRNPFAGEGQDARARILDGKGPDPLPPSCPEPLRNVIYKALAPALSDRYAGPAEMAHDLNKFLAGQPVSAQAPLGDETRRTHDPRTFIPKRQKRRFPPIRVRSVVLVIVLALVLAASWFIYRQIGVWSSAHQLREDLEADRLTPDVAWQKFQELRPHAHIPFLLWTVQNTLEKKLMEQGAEPIDDYRRDEPNSTENKWRHASDDFRRVLDLDPSNKQARGDLLLCEAHSERIQARKGKKGKFFYDFTLLHDAVGKFEKAEALLPNSADPYLGLARIYFYEQHDYEKGLTMLNEAARRGHPMGNREKLQQADALRFRATRSIQEAQAFSDMPDREKQYLSSARDDFKAALSLYDQLPPEQAGVAYSIRDVSKRLKDVDDRLGNAQASQ
jgi:serine/threonine protein kinase